MRRIASITAIITASLLLWACGNNTPKLIVSDVPIKTEVLGLDLCLPSSEKAIEKALNKVTGKYVLTETQQDGIATIVRAIPSSLEIPYGGMSWHYIDVTLDQNERIVQIGIVASFESVDRAKKQYDAAVKVFSQKYGQGNINEQHQNTFWTDNTNTVGLSYVESSSLNGNDRSFCTLYYLNRELHNTLEEANKPDV